MDINTSTRTLRIASAQYDIGRFENWAAFVAKAEYWTQQAVDAGARLLVWPEYASLELTSLFSAEIQQNLALQLEQLQTLREDFIALFTRLAHQHQVYLLPGTFPVKIETGEYRNRAWIFGPSGLLGFQDKLQMTRFENEQWHISPGHEIRVFALPFGAVGISTCYDSEFPLIARRMVELGAELILVPSCTDTLAGYHRVRIGCQARALENQCYVVQSPTVGNADWSAAVDINVGAAGVFTPVDRGFPDNGVFAQGPMNQPQWLFADLDLAAITEVRRSGQVLNHRDWPGQFRALGVSDTDQ
ncbi:MAG TPA: carbon-nitrogen hydrolase family protein [Dongiaceae bacterium]|nr:carbon-nitrogen hydrolase family protein [Dongiaceae bacterium]